MRPAVAIFGPDPLLSVTIESRAGADELHVHPAGQGVWVARAVTALGGRPILCGLVGGETGTVLEGLLARAGIELRPARTAGESGSYLVDRRRDGRRILASTARVAPGRHELDDLVELSSAAAFDAGLLVLCNPFPADGFPLDVYETVAAAARDRDVSLLVDLSSPRLEHVLSFHPDLVKLNDWELAQYACAPVDGARGLAVARRLCAAGARHVAVTRAGAPILVVPQAGDPFEIVPPELTRGFREGCGDTMMGAAAALWARGASVADALVVGAAAGSANFLRHGLGTVSRDAIEAMAKQVAIRPIPLAA